MKPRAEATKSAPTQNAQAASVGMINLPLATTLMRSRSPAAASVSTTDLKPTGFDAPDARHFLTDLGGRQDAALTGLRPLAQLELEHPDLGPGGDFPDSRLAQSSIGVPDAIPGRPDLKHEIRAAVEVIGREPPSAVLSQIPAAPAPRDKASTAGFEIAP